MVGAMVSVWRTGVAAIIGVSALLLAGCGGAAANYADLDGNRAPEDALPAISEDALGDLDPETSRFLGEFDGTELWLAAATAPTAAVCLVVMPDSGDWIAGCGADFAIGGPNGEFHVKPDGAPSHDHLTPLSENVYRID